MLDRFLQVGIINLHATLFKQELIGTIEATQVEFALDWQTGKEVYECLFELFIDITTSNQYDEFVVLRYYDQRSICFDLEL